VIMANSISGLGTERRPKNPDGELFQFGARCPVLLQTRHPRPVLVNRGKNRFSGRSIVKWLCEMTSAQGSGPRICQRIVGGHSLPGCHLGDEPDYPPPHAPPVDAMAVVEQRMRKPAKIISMPLPPMTSPGLHARQQHPIGQAGQSEARK